MSISKLDASSLSSDLVAALTTPRPDAATWRHICAILDAAQLSAQQLSDVKKALSSWPREVPRKAPLHWQQACSVVDLKRGSVAKGGPYPHLLTLCLDVTETEQLYNYYIAQISTSPRLRLRDGSPVVTLWRQMRGRVQLQNGTSLALGDGQPGLADLGGIMIVEWDTPCAYCGPPRRFHSCIREAQGYSLRRFNLYIEVEIKVDGKLPPGCREYSGTSTRQLTETEQDQIQRQSAQLARGGFYAFAERVDEAIESLCRHRDDVVARLS